MTRAESDPWYAYHDNGYAEFEVHGEGEFIAATSGLRNEALAEAARYARMYEAEGCDDVQIFEVARRPVQWKG